jgi:Tol biopolymer transport system component
MMNVGLRALVVVGLLQLAACGSSDPQLFGIYTSTLAGGDVRLVVASASQEMTHARVSPDHKSIAFTRYNDSGWNALATEERGYGETEIVVCRIDGSDIETIVPPKEGVVNSNPSWVDNGRSLMWVTTDTPGNTPQLWTIDIATRRRSRVPTPEAFATTDPDRVGDTIVFPVKKTGEPDAIFVMNADGTGIRQISRPKFPAGMQPGRFTLGDYDPKLSPDAKRVAFMRLFGEEGWRIFVADVATGEEKDMTGPGRIEGLPEWSSDGEWLLFRHIDRDKLHEMGVYVMRADGSERRMVPLPRGYLHNHPQFWPHAGSGPDAKIIYVARRHAALP